jgi:hypothetical protein
MTCVGKREVSTVVVIEYMMRKFDHTIVNDDWECN